MQNARKVLEIGSVYLHQSTLKSRAHSVDEFRPVTIRFCHRMLSLLTQKSQLKFLLTLFFKNRVGVLSVNRIRLCSTALVYIKMTAKSSLFV